jgi:2-dehydro-3-deoxyphosphogluconate aldolase/(4S)-4-hydroxy-2-oxoglutarate aldolase
MTQPGEELAARFESALADTPVIGIVRSTVPGVLPAVEALIEGGLRLVEVTLTTPGALAAIKSTAGSGAAALIGAGSVRTPADVELAVAARAEFLVTPTLDRETLATAQAHGVPVVCGAYTPTEIHQAATCGAVLVKVFPASTLGPAYLTEVLAPMPDLRLVPTGGVSRANMTGWFAAGASAVAIGSGLVGTDDIAEERWSDVRERAAAVVAAVAALRAGARS